MKLFNTPIILKFLGALLVMNGLAMLISSLLDLYYQENVFWGIFSAGMLSILIGALLFWKNHTAKKQLNKRDGYIIVSFGWLILTLSGALPYLFSVPFLSEQVLEANCINFTNCFFESVSGYTTTGATMLNDIEIMPKSLLFWRSFTHWIGGMGIIVLTIAILPLLGIGGMQLFMAEAPGVSADKLHPRITDTAKRLWVIYLALTFILTFLLFGAGMNFYDAINHAFSTMSTGGFSTKNSSMAYWNNNPLIQYIIILFMGIAGTNFVLSYFIFKGKFQKVIQDTEFLYYVGVVVSTTLIISVLVHFYADPTLTTVNHSTELINNGANFSYESSFRHSLFQVLTIITTTGFITADYTKWTAFVSIIYFTLFFLGGMAGSTSGGIKVVRHVILIKNSWNEFKRMMHPNAIIPLRFGGKPVSQAIVHKVLAFFMIYMLIFIFGSAIMGLMYVSDNSTDSLILSSLTVTASSLGNIGPAFGEFGPVNNYNALNDIGKWFSAFLMLLGRLELFTILILFTPTFWKR